MSTGQYCVKLYHQFFISLWNHDIAIFRPVQTNLTPSIIIVQQMLETMLDDNLNQVKLALYQ